MGRGPQLPSEFHSSLVQWALFPREALDAAGGVEEHEWAERDS
jgi:hypothetical protein